jgi:diphosphomevalonate decarboxylase
LTLARLAGAASGSAARSLYGGIVELTAGTDEIDLRNLAERDEWPLEVVVAVTEKSQKPVGSGDAMVRGAGTSPFYPSWIERQDEDMKCARTAVAERDFASLADIAEHNCLKMHSVMWTSRPPIVYWNKATLGCMEVVRSLRAAGHSVFFTIDAGPQVKAVCLPESADAVEAALSATQGVVQTMRSGLGTGARIIAT